MQELFQRFINLSVGLAFIAVLAMLVVAGFKFLTSGGDSKPLQSASMTLTWALVGVLFLVIAWLILQLIQAFTGVPVTKFCFGFPGVNNCP